MSKNRFIKRLSIIMCAIVLVCTSVIALTGAYFTSSSTVSGTIGMGKVAVHIYDEDGNNIDGSTTALNISNLSPGDKFLKPLTIKATDSELNVPVCLRLTMYVYNGVYTSSQLSMSKDDIDFDGLIGEGWVLYSKSDATHYSHNKIEWYYGHKNGNSVYLDEVDADIIISGMNIFVGADKISISTESAGITETANRKSSIIIYVDAIQSANIDTNNNGIVPSEFYNICPAKNSTTIYDLVVV